MSRVAAKPTLRDVSQQAGVSVITASRILNTASPRSNASAETIERVEQAACELGYRRHALARAMRHGRFGNVALIQGVGKSISTLPEGRLAGITETLSQHELSLMLARLPDEKLTSEGYVPRILAEHTSDGLIVNYTHRVPDAMVLLIEQHQIPSVWMNAKRPSDCVYHDDEGGARRLTERLIDQGHQRIAYLDLSHAHDQMPRVHYSAVDREEGYRRAMAVAGREALVIRPDHELANGERVAMVRSRFEAHGVPDALVGYSHAMVEVACVALYAMGRDGCSDVHFASFADDASWGLLEQPPTLMLRGEHAMGSAAVEMLIDKIDHPHRPQPARAVAMNLAVEGNP